MLELVAYLVSLLAWGMLASYHRDTEGSSENVGAFLGQNNEKIVNAPLDVLRTHGGIPSLSTPSAGINNRTQGPAGAADNDLEYHPDAGTQPNAAGDHRDSTLKAAEAASPTFNSNAEPNAEDASEGQGIIQATTRTSTPDATPSSGPGNTLAATRPAPGPAIALAATIPVPGPTPVPAPAMAATGPVTSSAPAPAATGLVPGSATAPVTALAVTGLVPATAIETVTALASTGLVPGVATAPAATGLVPGIATTPAATGLVPSSATTPVTALAATELVPATAIAPVTALASTGMLPGPGVAQAAIGPVPSSATAPVTALAATELVPATAIVPVTALASTGMVPGPGVAQAAIGAVTTMNAKDDASAGQGTPAFKTDAASMAVSNASYTDKDEGRILGASDTLSKSILGNAGAALTQKIQNMKDELHKLELKGRDVLDSPANTNAGDNIALKSKMADLQKEIQTAAQEASRLTDVIGPTFRIEELSAQLEELDRLGDSAKSVSDYKIGRASCRERVLLMV